MTVYTFRKKGKIILVLITSFAAGICNGFLGAGGGIILVFSLLSLFSDCFEDKKDIYANAQAIMLPISFFSYVLYCLNGSIKAENPALIAIPAILGGAVGGLLLSRFKSETVKGFFTAVVIISGIRMIM